KPEKMLKENGVAAERGIEEAEVEHALESREQQGYGDYRCAENEDDARGILRPTKERQTEPGHARSAHGVDGYDEIQAGENGRESVDEDSNDRRRDGGIRIDAAERSIKGPAGVQTAGAERIEHETAADDVDVPAQKVEFGKSQILGADHHGH